MTEILDGNAVAESVRADVAGAVDELEEAGVTPRLATVLMSTDPASETYVSMKQNDCEEVGIATADVELDPEAPAAQLHDTIDELNADADVDGILVQMPTPEHVDSGRVLRSLDPEKDVDGLHPENLGRLVAGETRYKPCTPHGVQVLLEEAGVDPEGKEAVVVGRSRLVGKPMANLFIQKAEGGNATTTVCHSRTEDLAAKTREADILVAAAGVPDMIDDAMVKEGAVVVDVGINQVDADTENGYELTGDVDFEAVRETASAITPVPGGVGPMTRAMLLYNTVQAARLRSGVDVSL
ncbi:MAG: bifunctional methylenetetrahydrofolate dehydrogenase/methenyltetrahydrofolate cyclohydrolase FolD [Haloplanus sp.]